LVKVVKEVTRGTPVEFEATFYDKDNEETVPASATLRLAYMVNGNLVANSISMTLDGNNYIAVWQSTGVDPGVVDWSVKPAGTEDAVEDGSLTVTANRANANT
jgi:hypothetical protein